MCIMSKPNVVDDNIFRCVNAVDKFLTAEQRNNMKQTLITQFFKPL